ncbi:MAG: ATP-binding cassette domain-containing protein, partial [Flavisolibacter sp.]
MLSIFKNTWSVLLSKEKKQFRWLAALDIMISMLDLASLALLLLIVRSYLDPVNPGVLPIELTIPGWSFVFIFFLFFSMKNVVAYLVSSAHHRFHADVAVRLSSQSLAAYQQSAFQDFVHTDASVQLRKIGFQPFEFCQYHLSGLQQLITQIFLISATIAAILFYDPAIFFLLLAVLGPPVISVFYLIRKKLGKSRLAIRDSNEHSFRYLLDAVHGFVESNIYDRHHFFRKRFLEQRKIFGQHLFHSLSIQNLPARFIEVFAVMGIFLIIAISQWMGAEGNSLLLTLGTFLAAAYKIIPGTVKLVNITGHMKANAFEFDALPAENGFSNQASLQGIEFRNVGFSYGDKKILRQLNFRIDRGDFVGIEGRSGIGKTTILNLVLGFVKPFHGKILFNGQPRDQVHPASWWPEFSYVKQQPFLIHDTLLKNIILDDVEADPIKLENALRISGLSDFCHQYADGLNYMIAEKGKNISGGQQQRIAIARALYKDSDVILLDEP